MKKNIKGGSANIMILAVVILAALVYFNVDLRSIVDGFLANPIVLNLFGFFVGVWTNYLAPLGSYLWNSITGLFG